ncbi:hypothetical protein P154DRAFT_575951 [Amniculicola lignicola CBS 123094]|uniref:Rab-GAP TBC domain-containing protein n=1 Tax=Amniculicola lignicola CBS 123094 TaxID=1392246 RepID=A0A6A5WFA9_9PLEO|nr:hypothetical protein P154DRAFT_575951 [Amniculicola lignicola CBS 123094]
MAGVPCQCSRDAESYKVLKAVVRLGQGGQESGPEGGTAQSREQATQHLAREQSVGEAGRPHDSNASSPFRLGEVHQGLRLATVTFDPISTAAICLQLSPPQQQAHITLDTLPPRSQASRALISLTLQQPSSRSPFISERKSVHDSQLGAMSDGQAEATPASQTSTRSAHDEDSSPATSNATSTSSRAPPSRGWLSGVRRPRTSPGPKTSALKTPALKTKSFLAGEDVRRDSALASSNSTASTDRTPTDAPPSPTSLRKTPSLPAIIVQDDPAARPQHQLPSTSGAPDPRPPTACDDVLTFQGIDTFIPTGGFDDLTSPSQVSFSKRGSMLLGGKKANRMKKQLGLVEEGTPAAVIAIAPATPGHPPPQEEEEPAPPRQLQDTPQKGLSTPATPRLSPRSPSRFSARGRAFSNRVLSADEMMLSRKVRSMYKHGNESAADWDGCEDEGTSSFVDNSSLAGTPVNASSLTVDRPYEDSSSFMSSRRASAIVKEPTETAGGVEDWADIEGGEVDRYGFIMPKKMGSQGSGTGADGPDEPRMQRVSTALQLVSEEPRRRGMGRSASRARSATSANPKSRKSAKSVRPAASLYSNQTSNTRSTQRPLRYATNRFPHNKDRRLMDEAADMLKLPPGLAELEEQAEGGRIAQAMKTKEVQREEKWRKMAKVVHTSEKGGGMMFEFDTKDPKVISRTWKGIPDRWRGTAWYAFLAASAKADKDSPTDEELYESFYELQEESSADDMQIDVDVPRTINRHIMFRRRYRGGQRLLFRVLHAMSLYLPDTGYVQGMAALAATLLCYYEEDKAFVMLVRLWMLRGLERLYESGFSGLMDALDEFEKSWLRGGDVAKKLEELGITSTAYGTRWYLTLFNYSLPFPAQLRVWDVFMLLGDASLSNSPASKFSGDLDVLHATSAALIDATREILIDADFENAMKVLTSWIPIKDEDLLMKVAKAEYKMRKKRATTEVGANAG